MERNFAFLEVTGPRKERKLKITYYSTKGKKLYEYEITPERY
jgi:alkaline phosphatase D